MDWTAEKAEAASRELSFWRSHTENVAEAQPNVDVLRALCSDLNTHGAITVLRELFRQEKFGELKASAHLLGLLSEELNWNYPDNKVIRVEPGVIRLKEGSVSISMGLSEEIKQLIDALIAEREEARKAKNFVRADALRDGFRNAGLIVSDSAEGVVWEQAPDFDPSKLEALK